MAPLRIGIVGAGNVGKNLGKRLVEHGKHTVKYGARDPAKYADLGAVSVPEVSSLQCPLTFLTRPL